MKKIISVLLMVAMLTPCASVFAEESSVKEPKLIYNYSEISGEGSTPFIADGRTMLPFRYFLEAIDADVNYDEETRIVQALKDEIAISFSLDDTYIDISKNGSTPERIVQDTANIIKDDRVYVPIRFMSEAFELNVGWDESEKTAIIIDLPKYLSELSEKTPILGQYMEICSKIPESYTQTLDMNFDFSTNIPEVENLKLNLSLDSECSMNENSAEAEAILNLETNLINMISGININKLEDVTFSFMYKDSIIYIKTNLVEKLQEILSDNDELKNISMLVNKDKWFSADISELFKIFGIPTEYIDIIKTSLKGGTTDITEIFKNMVPANNIQTIAEAEAIDLLFEAYAQIFPKMITIKDNGNDNYDINIKFSKDDFKELLTSLSPEIASDPESSNIFENMIFDISGNVVVSNNIATNSDMTISFDMEGILMDISLNSTLIPDTNKKITVPESTLDLINIITILQ